MAYCEIIQIILIRRQLRELSRWTIIFVMVLKTLSRFGGQARFLRRKTSSSKAVVRWSAGFVVWSPPLAFFRGFALLSTHIPRDDGTACAYTLPSPVVLGFHGHFLFLIRSKGS